MNPSIKITLASVSLAFTGTLASASEMNVLSDAQLDAISAGAQHSIVSGAGYAEAGTVSVNANAKSISKSNGGSMTKADVKVIAVGTGIGGFAIGESAAGQELSGAIGEAVVDQGRLTIRIKTMSKVNGNGAESTKTKVHVKAHGSGAQSFKTMF